MKVGEKKGNKHNQIITWKRNLFYMLFMMWQLG